MNPNANLPTPDHSARVCPAERRWVWVFATLALLLTSLPYFIGFSAQGAEWRFTGFVFGVEDGNSYIAKMLAGSSGAWLFRTPYTILPQRGVVMFLPYLLLGKLAAPPDTHTQLVVLFHLYRLCAGLLAILATYDFLAYFIVEIRLRRLGLALATLGGGLGWALVLAGKDGWLGSLPLDFYSPETFGFLGLWGVAHLSLARASLLWGLLAWLDGVQVARLSGRQVMKLSGWWLLALLAQPLAGGVLALVIGLHLAALAAWLALARAKGDPGGWQRWAGRVKLAVAAGILPLVFVAYTFWSLATDPFLRIWSAQNLIRSPHPLHYLVAYGLVIPFAVAGARRLLRALPWSGWLPAAWALAFPVLAYIPINLQRRLPEGVWVALLVLALAALDRREASLQAGQAIQAPNPLARQAFFTLSPLLFLSTLLLLAGGLMASVAVRLPVFRPAAEVEAFETLADRAPSGAVVVAAYDTANALPAWAPVRVVIGHGPESANLAALLPQVEMLYAAATRDEQRQNLLRQWGVQYLFWGPAERALGGWNPELAPYLQPFYSGGDYRIFTVSPLGAP